MGHTQFRGYSAGRRGHIIIRSIISGEFVVNWKIFSINLIASGIFVVMIFGPVQGEFPFHVFGLKTVKKPGLLPGDGDDLKEAGLKTFEGVRKSFEKFSASNT